MGRTMNSLHLPTLGRRGGGWVVAQVFLVAAVFLSALTGHGWVGLYSVVGLAVLGAGLMLLVVAALQLGTSLTPFPAPKADELTTTGAFALVRHPMYGGGALIALGWTIAFPSIIGFALTLLLVVFLDLKSRREEIWLRERYDEYGSYCARTRHKILPFIY